MAEKKLDSTLNKRVLLSGLVPHPRNYNKHDAGQVEDLRESLRQFSQVRSIVVQASKTTGQYLIVAGHGIVEAARQEGLKSLKADVIPATWKPARVLAYLAADNELARRGSPDEAQLAALVAEVQAKEGDVLARLAAGEQAALDRLLAVAGGGGDADAEPQIDRAKELNEKWKVKPGDLFRIADHRLLCGDSTKREDVERVMGGDRARLVFTSPPYADQRDYEIGKFDWLTLMNAVTDCMFSVLGTYADVVINLGMSYKDGRVNFYWNDWLKHCEGLCHPLYGWYVWDKGHGFPGEWNGRLAPAHEFIFHFSIGRISANHWVPKAESSFDRNKYAKKAIQRKADGDYKPPSSPNVMGQPFKIPDSVIRMQHDTEGYGNHPAIFPVSFPEFGIRTWGDLGVVVFDPFAGSGSTIVACQSLNRKCRAIEISPAYCAVILQRMTDAFPGILIERIADHDTQKEAKRRRAKAC